MADGRGAVLHVLAPGPVGGLESVVRLLTAGLAARRRRVGVLAVLDEGSEPPALLEAMAGSGVEVVRLPLPPRAYGKERRNVERVLAEFRPGVVHTHGYRSDVIAAGAARKLGLPAVTTVHGFTGGGWKNRLYEWLQVRAFRRMDAVIAVSRPLVDRLAAAGVRRDRIVLLPNAWADGAEPLSRSEARERLGLAPEGFVVGWVGRMSREKGLDVLLSALRLVGGPPLLAAVVGDGRARPGLQAGFSDLEAAGRLRWCGLQPDAGRMFRAFDLFVLSSRTEGTPVTLFEAMAAGVPIVATAVGGVPQVLTADEAWLVPSESPAELADAIRDARGDPALREARAAAAGRRLRDRFATGRWLDRHEALYDQLAAARPRKEP